MPGRPPKPTHLHVVQGTFNATRHKGRKDEPVPTGKPVKPPFVKGRAAKLWVEYSRIGYWLTEADSHALAIYCALSAEAEKDLGRMNSSRISQWRAMSHDLGFDPASRTKIRVGSKEEDLKKESKDPAAAYLA